MQIFAFSTEGGRGLVVAYKHKGSPETIFLDVDPGELYVTDLMGNQIDASIPGDRSAIELTDQPVYVESKTLTAAELKTVFSDAWYESSQIVTINNVYFRSLNELVVAVINNTDQAVEASVSLQVPGAVGLAETEQLISLGPPGYQEVVFGSEINNDPLTLIMS